MPNRIIKESIRTSDSINELSWFEECLFYRLIVSCDDYGRFDGRPAIIKGTCFPLKEGVTTKNIESALSKLTSAGLVKRYVVDGKPYLSLPSWGRHQTTRAAKSKYPNPDDGEMISSENNCMQMNADAHVFEFDIRNSINDNNNMSSRTSPDRPEYPYKDVIDYLNLKAGTAFRSTSKDTQKHIRARIDEGYTLDDFKKVIDSKVSQWGKEPRPGEKDMRVYLRPSTLFGTKFEGYLQEKPAGTSTVSVRNNNNFERRRYDMDKLERQLMEGQSNE